MFKLMFLLKLLFLDEDLEDCISCWINEKFGYDQMDWIIGCGEIVSFNIGLFYDYIKKIIYGCYLYIDIFSVSYI